MNKLLGQPPKNVAAWELTAKARTLTVSNADYKTPGPDELVVKVIDVAINPIDFIMQDNDIFKLKYPNVFGTDCAGEVVEVGQNVKDIRTGARVIAHMDSYSTNDPARGAFQRYAVVRKIACCSIPYELFSSTAVVLPLSISTASAGLFPKDYLNLPIPVTPKDSEAPPPDFTKDKPTALLVWGGSSSVGSSTIQLARASLPDLHILTTCSPANNDYCKDLGATACFDYHASDVEDQIIKYLQKPDKSSESSHITLLGAYHANGGEPAFKSCANILDKSHGKAIVVTVQTIPEKGVPDSVRTKQISSSDIFNGGEDSVGAKIWNGFLPKALEKKIIKPKPDPDVVGQELRSVQAGIDKLRKGVSAKKVVVSGISTA